MEFRNSGQSWGLVYTGGQIKGYFDFNKFIQQSITHMTAHAHGAVSLQFHIQRSSLFASTRTSWQEQGVQLPC